ncbi:MAG TPA: tRNA (adenosine(37)-N6)-dimethylallyltransferase MiaA [Solirubrobacterales bacterium]|nr:tRNA (adenosine(37)-N6)-dimethylallyltransferase MiaA [Solirubrobacterales bacterium]
MRLVALFGPTASGKTGVAVSLAELLRERGEDPVAISCDAIQVYEGLEILSGAATVEERARLEHRLLGMVPIDGEFSAGRFATLAHAEIDQLLAEGRRPILVGGTGLYMRAALSDLDLRPPVPDAVRAEVEAELAERGPEALHAELDPDLAVTVHPNDRKRISRLTELQRAGIAPARSSERLWSEELRRPSLLVGLVLDRDDLRTRIDARVEEMVRMGAEEEIRNAAAAGASRTARAAIGFEELLAGDTEAMRTAQWRYARRQLTWMRKMGGVEMIDRTGRDDGDVAVEIAAMLE